MTYANHFFFIFLLFLLSVVTEGKICVVEVLSKIKTSPSVLLEEFLLLFHLMLAPSPNSLSVIERKKPRIRASTVRKKYASFYARIMESAPRGTIDYVPYVLGELEGFERIYTKPPEDVRALIDILRTQTQTLLGKDTDDTKYYAGLEYMNEKGGALLWYHTYVAKPIREGKMSWNGKIIKK